MLIMHHFIAGRVIPLLRSICLKHSPYIIVVVHVVKSLFNTRFIKKYPKCKICVSFVVESSTYTNLACYLENKSLTTKKIHFLLVCIFLIFLIESSKLFSLFIEFSLICKIRCACRIADYDATIAELC